MATTISSFTTAVKPRAHLQRAPLERVIAQVRWNELSSLQNGFIEVASRLGQQIEAEYPFSSSTQETSITFGPQGVTPGLGPTIKQFRSEDDHWRVYLSSTYLSLESTEYKDVEDFKARLSFILDALTTVVRIPFANRIGFRYFNRVTDGDVLESLSRYVSPALIGASELSGAGIYRSPQSVTVALYTSDSISLATKWALLPADTTVDPMIEAVSVPSWILDIDASEEARHLLDHDSIDHAIDRLHEAAYTFFRHVVTDEFLTHFGEVRDV